MRKRLSLALCSAVALLCGTASRATAWDAREHERLGEVSYERACAELRDEITPGASAEVADRLAHVCQPWRVTSYAQMTMLSGDHIGDRELLLSRFPEAIRNANSFLGYVALALENDAHFNPLSQQAWMQAHDDAVGYAKGSFSAQDPVKAAILFDQAFYANAFADHFLQDSFAAGHAGFARGSTGPGASKMFHDKVNAYGRRFMDEGGREWTAYGDGHLLVPEHAMGRALLTRAATLSVKDILRAAATGEVTPEHQRDLLARLPLKAKTVEWTRLGEGVHNEYGTATTGARGSYMGPNVSRYPRQTDGWLLLRDIPLPAQIDEVVTVVNVQTAWRPGEARLTTFFEQPLSETLSVAAGGFVARFYEEDRTTAGFIFGLGLCTLESFPFNSPTGYSTCGHLNLGWGGYSYVELDASERFWIQLAEGHRFILLEPSLRLAWSFGYRDGAIQVHGLSLGVALNVGFGYLGSLRRRPQVDEARLCSESRPHFSLSTGRCVSSLLPRSAASRASWRSSKCGPRRRSGECRPRCSPRGARRGARSPDRLSDRPAIDPWCPSNRPQVRPA